MSTAASHRGGGKTGGRPRARAPILAWLFLLALAAGPARAQGTPGPHGRLSRSIDCADCHTDDAWTPARSPMAFDHAAQTGFPLLGAHRQANCRSCHLELRFDEPRLAPNDCASCHLDVHQGNLSSDCASCHAPTSFSDVEAIPLHARTSFPLTGSHVQLTCESCHTDDRGGTFSPLNPACISCHEQDYAGAQAIDHVASGFPTECGQCHTTLSWQAATFDHAAASGGFALAGGHAALPCGSCHRMPGLEPIFHPADQNDCLSCHESDYRREHDHPAFPTTCLSCHDIDGWQGATVDHASVSGGFALVGAHTALACESCHRLPDFAPIASPADQNDCFSCHEPEYRQRHEGTGFPTTCLSCHNTSGWEGAVFEHGAVSGGFDLVGAHAALACESCHRVPGYEPIFHPADQNDCLSCHESDYRREHDHPAFPTTCLSCHDIDGWQGATVDHASVSGGFALVGAHTALACESCHRLPDFAPIFHPAGQNDCLSCHRSDYDREHAGTGFPTTCLTCHDTSGWEGASFEHDQRYFPIYSGDHRGEWASCQTCHADPSNFRLFTCLTCHEHSQDRMDDKHREVGGYAYESSRCYSCHPNGEED